MLIFFSWAFGLIQRRPTRLVGAMIGVALGLALLACLGSFVDSSARTMTRRALSALPLDWQIRFNSLADEARVRAAVHETDPNAVMEVAGYADVPSLLAKTGQTVQTTGAAVVLGFDENYAASFPEELAPMIGARDGILAQQQTAANLNISVGDSVRKLSRIVASSLARQGSVLARSMCMVALAISFAVSTAIFNATYQTQARVDAELTNGADVTVSVIPSATTASDILKSQRSGLTHERALSFLGRTK